MHDNDIHYLVYVHKIHFYHYFQQVNHLIENVNFFCFCIYCKLIIDDVINKLNVSILDDNVISSVRICRRSNTSTRPLFNLT